MKNLWPPLLLWLALWLGGSAWCAWSLQSDVQSAAGSVLAAQTDKLNFGTQLNVAAHGRSIELSGKAFRESDLKLVAHSLTNDVRIPGTLNLGNAINPVLAFKNRIELQTRPTGWGMLVASTGNVRLHGTAGSEFESQRIVTSLRSAAPNLSVIDNLLVIDPDAWTESDHLEDTLGKEGSTTNLPPLNELRLSEGLLAVARWGEPWKLLNLTKPMESLRQEVTASGVLESAWHDGLAADIEHLRDFRAAWTSAQREAGRLSNLPPGHVVLALRGDSLLLRGEQGDEQSRNLIVDAVSKAVGDRRVIDEIIRSPHRRPEPDVRPLVNTVPSLPGGLLAKAIAIGSASKGWTQLNLATLDMLDEPGVVAQIKPSGIDPRLVMPDMLAAVAWLNSLDDAPIRIDGAKRLPFLVLISVGNRLLLRGAVADESTRTQVEAAARKLYLNRSIDSAIRLDTACASMNGIMHTTTSMPDLPAMNTTGIIAVAIPGDVWHTKIMRIDLLDEAGLDKSGIVPEGLTIHQVMPDLLDVADIVRAHIATVNKAPRGIPLQAP